MHMSSYVVATVHHNRYVTPIMWGNIAVSVITENYFGKSMQIRFYLLKANLKIRSSKFSSYTLSEGQNLHCQNFLCFMGKYHILC